MPETGAGERRRFRLVFVPLLTGLFDLARGAAGSLAAVAVEEASRLKGGGC